MQRTLPTGLQTNNSNGATSNTRSRHKQNSNQTTNDTKKINNKSKDNVNENDNDEEKNDTKEENLVVDKKAVKNGNKVKQSAPTENDKPQEEEEDEEEEEEEEDEENDENNKNNVQAPDDGNDNKNNEQDSENNENVNTENKIKRKAPVSKQKNTKPINSSSNDHKSRLKLTPKKTPRIARVTKGRSVEFTLNNVKLTGWIVDQTDKKVNIRWRNVDGDKETFVTKWFLKSDQNLHVFDRRYDAYVASK